LNHKISDISDLIEYRELVNSQPETEFQKITLEIVDKAIENLRKRR